MNESRFGEIDLILKHLNGTLEIEWTDSESRFIRELQKLYV